MNEIDLIVIANIIAFLTMIFLVYRWYNGLLKTHGKIVALLLPISLIALLVSFNAMTENDVKRISESKITEALDKQKLKENNANSKSIVFSKDVSLLQKLHFGYEIGLDSLTKNYGIKKELLTSYSGVTSNLDWTDYRTNMIKVNDSTYDFKIKAYYNAKILFILSYNGEKEFTKRINIKSYQ